MKQKPEKTFDSRKYQGRLERELIIGGILIGLIVGGGLIYLFWGMPGFLTALSCFVGFLVLIGGIWGFLKLIEVVTRD